MARTAPAATATPGRPSGAGPGEAVVYIMEPDGPDSEAIGALVRRLGATPRFLRDTRDLVQAHPGERTCVVAEMSLPGGDGLALLESLKTHGLRIPVIFVTADRDVGRAVSALRAGATDYLVKPWVEQRLAARLRSVLALPDSPGPP